MTTIFGDHKSGVMVADSKCSDSNGTWYEITKIYKFGDELIGVSGNLKDIHAWLDWYTTGKNGAFPKIKEFGALSLRPDGLVEHCNDGLEVIVERGFHGVGSGGCLAVAAFMAGADPKKSVQIACQIDANSGGRIVSHKLKGKK